MLDARGLETTAAGEAAVRNLDDTLSHYLRFGIETGDCLKRTLAADPEMALAHCMKGYFFMLFCVPALAGKARASLDAARRSVAERGATDRERRHLDALDAWIRGEFAQAAAHLEAALAGNPRDILALKLAHYLHFYLGDDENMRDSVGRVLHAWDDTVDGYGYVPRPERLRARRGGCLRGGGARGKSRGGAQSGRSVGGARGRARHGDAGPPPGGHRLGARE